jgi:hypothetical protein
LRRAAICSPMEDSVNTCPVYEVNCRISIDLPYIQGNRCSPWQNLPDELAHSRSDGPMCLQRFAGDSGSAARTRAFWMLQEEITRQSNILCCIDCFRLSDVDLYRDRPAGAVVSGRSGEKRSSTEGSVDA